MWMFLWDICYKLLVCCNFFLLMSSDHCNGFCGAFTTIHFALVTFQPIISFMWILFSGMHYKTLVSCNFFLLMSSDHCKGFCGAFTTIHFALVTFQPIISFMWILFWDIFCKTLVYSNLIYLMSCSHCNIVSVFMGMYYKTFYFCNCYFTLCHSCEYIWDMCNKTWVYSNLFLLMSCGHCKCFYGACITKCFTLATVILLNVNLVNIFGTCVIKLGSIVTCFSYCLVAIVSVFAGMYYKCFYSCKFFL
jgi:hypothetical protein